MSKSKGNTMAPQEISNTLGAEILRLWVASSDYSSELNLSSEILKRVVESYRRVRNTLRFLLANTSDFDPRRNAAPVNDLVEIDRYALAMTVAMQAEVTADYERYQFHLVAQKLLAFCSRTSAPSTSTFSRTVSIPAPRTRGRGARRRPRFGTSPTAWCG